MMGHSSVIRANDSIILAAGFKILTILLNNQVIS